MAATHAITTYEERLTGPWFKMAWMKSSREITASRHQHGTGTLKFFAV